MAANPLLNFNSLFIDRVTYLLSISTTCLCTVNSTLAQVRGQISLFIASSGFRKLATCISWAAFNGSNLANKGFIVCVETVAADDVP